VPVLGEHPAVHPVSMPANRNDRRVGGMPRNSPTCVPSLIHRTATFALGYDVLDREPANVMRSCGRELTPSKPPSARLQPVHELVKQACQEYDKGTECLSTLVKEWNLPVGTDEKRYSELFDCGRAAQIAGGKLLTDAVVKGFKDAAIR